MKNIKGNNIFKWKKSGLKKGTAYKSYVKAYVYKDGKLNYYRDTNQKEIDLVIDSDGILHPFEIKRAASPDKKPIKSFSLLAKSGRTIGSGGIICMAEKPLPIDEMNNLIPANLI